MALPADLEALPRRELQALAKAHGIPANQKSAVIVEALREKETSPPPPPTPEAPVATPAVQAEAKGSAWPTLGELAQDLQAGITVTIVSIPTSVAYADLAGLYGINGLTRIGPALFVHGLLSGVKWLATGMTSLTAISVVTDLNSEAFKAEHGFAAYEKLVFLYALVIGVVSLVMAALQLGSLAKKIPKPVMSGFKWGAAFIILASQSPGCVFNHGKNVLPQLMKQTPMWLTVSNSLPSLFSGVKNVMKLAWIWTHPQFWTPMTALFGLSTVFFILNAGKILPKALARGGEVLVVCIIATLASLYLGYSDQGDVIGEVPSDNVSLIPRLYLDDLPWAEASRLIMPAIIFSAVDFSATVAICATFEQENGVEWNPNRELAVQGVANLVAGATGCQPVGGSLSRSLVTRLANAASSRVAMINGIGMMVMIPILWIVAATPKSVLAGIVMSQIVKTVLYPKNLLAFSGTDAILAWGTGITTIVVSPSVGICAGCALALAVRLTFGAAKATKAD